MADRNHIHIRQTERLSDIPAAQWNGLSLADNPLLRYEFLHGLEANDCLQGHGWSPHHFLAYEGERLLAAIPLYLKYDSYGEFVFDWSWADAYERAGGQYYPKLVSSIPFSPVSGPRLLLHPECSKDIASKLINAVVDFAQQQGLSSIHVLFCDEQDREILSEAGFMPRYTWQYHWQNQQYTDFDDFLSHLTSKRRKQIRKERREIRQNGLEIEVLCGRDITMRHWQVFYDFYCSTFQRKWGSPRFTLGFFYTLGQQLEDAPVLILARDHSDYVAGSFALSSKDTLYGRHWGCHGYHRNLHFELCYYQTIEYCIRHNLQRLDAGIQGEHKILRGFLPVKACSMHWIREPQFKNAVKNFLHQESRFIDEQIAMLKQHSPYKQDSNRD